MYIHVYPPPCLWHVVEWSSSFYPGFLEPWGLLPCPWPASRRDLRGNPPPPAEKSRVAWVPSILIFPSFFLMMFYLVFGSVLGDPGASQGLPKYIKIHPKCTPKSIYVLLPFFFNKKHAKMLPNQCQNLSKKLPNKR